MIPKKLEFAQDRFEGVQRLIKLHSQKISDASIAHAQAAAPASKPARRIVPMAVSDNDVPAINSAFPAYIPTGQPSVQSTFLARMDTIIDEITRRVAIRGDSDDGGGVTRNDILKGADDDAIDKLYKPISSDDEEDTEDRIYVRKVKKKNVTRGVRVKKARIRRKQLNPKRAK
jgi:hypothetical protein